MATNINVQTRKIIMVNVNIIIIWNISCYYDCDSIASHRKNVFSLIDPVIIEYLAANSVGKKTIMYVSILGCFYRITSTPYTWL